MEIDEHGKKLKLWVRRKKAGLKLICSRCGYAELGITGQSLPVFLLGSRRSHERADAFLSHNARPMTTRIPEACDDEGFENSEDFVSVRHPRPSFGGDRSPS